MRTPPRGPGVSPPNSQSTPRRGRGCYINFRLVRGRGGGHFFWVPLFEILSNRGIARFASEKKVFCTSSPMLFSPNDSAAAIVDPDPMNGSSTMPLPNGNDAHTICFISMLGFSEGCGAIFFSRPLAGPATIKSLKGISGDGRRSAPVPHLFKLSLILPSMGFLKINHGSQHDLGLTETSLNVL